MKTTSNLTLKPLYPAHIAWLGMVVLYIGFMSMGAMFHLIPPILPQIFSDLHLSHGQGGMLMSLFALPGIGLSLFAGWLVDRFGERAMGSLGILIMGSATVALSVGGGFSLILLARLCTGLGAVIGVVAMQRMVTRLFQGRPLGLPTGISGSAVPLGIVVIYTVAGPLAEAQGWRTVPLRAGVVCVAVAVVFFLAGRTLLSSQEVLPRSETFSEALGSTSGLRIIWLAGLIWFFINGAMTAFLTFAPDHYLALGFGSRERGLFTSVPLWGSALLGPLVGWLADGFGGRSCYIAAGMGLLTLSFSLVAADSVPPLWLGLSLGMSMALVVTPLLSLPGQILPPSHHGRGFGILSTCANAGIFVVPPLAGWVRDRSGGYFWPFVLMAALALAGVLMAVPLRRMINSFGGTKES